MNEHLDGAEQLVLGVSWPGRVPHLDLAALGVRGARGSVGVGRDQSQVPLLGRLGFRVSATGRYCTGWYGFDRDGTGQRRPCPDGARVASGRQCADCALRDQFRFAHQGHLGGYVPPALEGYLASPHWLYLATFADGFTKVGTAALSRRESRLDEQGPLRATRVARAANGRLVREAEDEVSRRLEVPQHRRRTAKAAAYVDPAPPAAVRARHRETVAQTVELLAGTGWSGSLEPVDDPWDPPPASRALHSSPPSGRRLAYPHRLDAGEHGLLIEAAAGPVVLARTQPDPEALRYVADLGELVGCRIVLGPYTSAEAELQETLF